MAGGLQMIRWRRAKSARTRLAETLRRLTKIDMWIFAAAIDIDRRLDEGVGWVGVSIWPDRLAGRLAWLEGQIDELEHILAETRAQDGHAANERLRADIELLATSLRRAAELYVTGAIDAYQRYEGRPIETSAGGREPVLLAGPGDVDELADLRRAATMLFRTCMIRLGMEQLGERYEVRWPVHRWEAADIWHQHGEGIWGGGPRPIDP